MSSEINAQSGALLSTSAKVPLYGESAQGTCSPDTRCCLGLANGPLKNAFFGQKVAEK